MTENIKKVLEIMPEDINAFLVMSCQNRFYLTNFSSSDGYVVIKDKKVFFITDFRYYESAVIRQKKGQIDRDIEIVLQSSKVFEKIKQLLGDSKRVLFEDKYVSCRMFSKLKENFPDITFEFGSEIFEKCRAAKTKEEIRLIKEAQKITDKAFEYILDVVSDNVGKKDFTERKAKLYLENYMLENGAQTVSFDTISLTGKKTSLPHGEPDETIIGKGFLTFDFGAKLNGYCSDMTRTICIGKPDEQMKKVYDTVLKAQNAAFEKIHGQVPGKDVDFAARQVIENAGFKGAFGHSLGHSLGIDIHESPNFSPSESAGVPCGAVVSVEPGIYLEGLYGVRIEDIVVVLPTGYENLTSSKKELVVI